MGLILIILIITDEKNKIFDGIVGLVRHLFLKPYNSILNVNKQKYTLPWLTGEQNQKGAEAKIISNDEIHYRPMLPSPYRIGSCQEKIFLGKASLKLQ
ncbi:MAG: hypothetical protein ABIY62_08550 [Ginsengibacter sp.]